MKSLTVRPSRMLTNPSVKVTNVGDGGAIVTSEDDEDIELFQETAAIPLSLYRKWGGHKEFDRKRYEAMFRRATGKPNSYRIYLPVEATEEDLAKKAKVNVEVPEPIIKALDDQGYVIDDYIAGIAVDKEKGKRKIKIGKLLAKFPDLKKKYDADPQRQGSKVSKTTMLAVISRHPYDIAGMSTNRGWKSCTELYDGINRRYVIQDVRQGSLIAYLVKSDDKNINRPIARVRIYAFRNVADDNEVIFVREPTTYGTATPQFKKVVDNWLDRVNTAVLNGKKTTTVFKVSQEVYEDALPSRQVILVSDPDNLPDLDALGSELNGLKVSGTYDIDAAFRSKDPLKIIIGLRSPQITPAHIDTFLRLKFKPKAKDEYYKTQRLNTLWSRSYAFLAKSNYVTVDQLKKLLDVKKDYENVVFTRAGANPILSAAEIEGLVAKMRGLLKKSNVPHSDKNRVRYALEGLYTNVNCPSWLWITELTLNETGDAVDLLNNRQLSKAALEGIIKAVYMDDNAEEGEIDEYHKDRLISKIFSTQLELSPEMLRRMLVKNSNLITRAFNCSVIVNNKEKADVLFDLVLRKEPFDLKLIPLDKVNEDLVTKYPEKYLAVVKAALDRILKADSKQIARGLEPGKGPLGTRNSSVARRKACYNSISETVSYLPAEYQTPDLLLKLVKAQVKASDNFKLDIHNHTFKPEAVLEVLPVIGPLLMDKKDPDRRLRFRDILTRLGDDVLLNAQDVLEKIFMPYFEDENVARAMAGEFERILDLVNAVPEGFLLACAELAKKTENGGLAISVAASQSRTQAVVDQIFHDWSLSKEDPYVVEKLFEPFYQQHTLSNIAFPSKEQYKWAFDQKNNSNLTRNALRSCPHTDLMKGLVDKFLRSKTLIRTNRKAAENLCTMMEYLAANLKLPDAELSLLKDWVVSEEFQKTLESNKEYENSYVLRDAQYDILRSIRNAEEKRLPVNKIKI